MFRKLLIPMIFLVGIGIFFYPTVANLISAKDHYTVMSEYNEALAKMTKDQKQKEKEKADAYNEEIHETDVPLEDPFSEAGKAMDTGSDGYYSALDIGKSMGSIEIPEINVDLPIYHGVSDDVLQQGIGHMSNSSLPVGGKGTHSALTGHRGLPSSTLFRHLDQLNLGDTFFIHTLDETLAYKIDDVDIVKPTETEWLNIDKDHDYVTLITCDPYMINTERMLVRGERVPYEETMESSAVPKPPTKSWLLEYKYMLLLGLALIITLTSLYIARKRKMEASRGDR